MDDILQKTVDEKYKIQPNMQIASDGGTIAFAVKDDSGIAHTLFLDRRINSDSKDTFYKGAYPGAEGSVELGKNDDLVIKLESSLKDQFSSH